MSSYDWAKLLLVQFLVPMAWPLVAFYFLWNIRTELKDSARSFTTIFLDLLGRIKELKFGNATIKINELKPPKTQPLDPP